MLNNLNRYFSLSLIALLFSLQSVLFAQDIPKSWDIIANSQEIEQIQETIKSRSTLKGTRINAMRVGAGLYGLSFAATTLNGLYQIMSTGAGGLYTVGLTALNASSASYLIDQAINARKNFDDKTLRKLLRVAKSNEQNILAKLKIDLLKQDLELVSYKNHTNNKVKRFFKHGDAKITLVIKRVGKGSPVEIEFEPKMTFETKKQKVLGRSYSKRTTTIKEFKFIAKVVNNPISEEVLSNVAYTNSIIDRLAALNTCNYFLF